MATLSINPQPYAQPEFLPPNSGAVECDHQLRRAAKGLKNSFMMLAYYGWRMREEGLFSALGFESEDAYRESIDVPRSTWYKSLRIGQLLSGLSLEELQSLSTGNAELLTQVDPSLMTEYPWVEDAKRLPPGEFAQLVNQRNQSTGTSREVWAYYRVKVPYPVKDFLETAIESFRIANDLATPAQALEFMVADRFDRRTEEVMLTEARTYLNRAIYSLEHRVINKTSEEIYFLKKARESLDEARSLKVPHSSQAASGEDGQVRQ